MQSAEGDHVVKEVVGGLLGETKYERVRAVWRGGGTAAFGRW